MAPTAELLLVEELEVDSTNSTRASANPRQSLTLEATQGQIDGFISQLPYKCYLEEVASVGH